MFGHLQGKQNDIFGQSMLERKKTCKVITFISPKSPTSVFYWGLSVTRKKSPNVYKSCPKMISLKKWPKNVEDLGKLIVAKGFKSGQKSNKSPNLVTLIGVINAHGHSPQHAGLQHTVL